MPKSMINTQGQSRLAASKAIASIANPIVCLVVAIAIAALASVRPAFATEILRCARFDQGELPVPLRSPYSSAVELRLETSSENRITARSEMQHVG